MGPCLPQLPDIQEHGQMQDDEDRHDEAWEQVERLDVHRRTGDAAWRQARESARCQACRDDRDSEVQKAEILKAHGGRRRVSRDEERPLINHFLVISL
jgi:hypothetical protein